jgi:hypothetical protein
MSEIEKENIKLLGQDCFALSKSISAPSLLALLTIGDSPVVVGRDKFRQVTDFSPPRTAKRCMVE